MKLEGEPDRFSPQSSAPNADGTYAALDLGVLGVVHPNLPDPGWVATTGGPGGDPCSHGLVPSSWHGTTVYEANIGFKRGHHQLLHRHGLRRPEFERRSRRRRLACRASSHAARTQRPQLWSYSARQHHYRFGREVRVQRRPVRELPGGDRPETAAGRQPDHHPELPATHVHRGRTDLTADIPATFQPPPTPRCSSSPTRTATGSGTPMKARSTATFTPVFPRAASRARPQGRPRFADAVAGPVRQQRRRRRANRARAGGRLFALRLGPIRPRRRLPP